MRTVVRAGIRGEERENSLVFRGIPYGRVEGRFTPALPASLPAFPFDALHFPSAMPQRKIGEDTFYGREFYWGENALPRAEENSLFLNIWTPKDEEDCPVVVFFHGGAFNHGWASEVEFDGEKWGERGVILVTVQYRLGLPGYITLEGEKCNLGLRDQALAADWVRNNIALFGGDVNRISLMGQSAGGCSVEVLVSSSLLTFRPYSLIIMSAGGPGGPIPLLERRRKEAERTVSSFLVENGITREKLCLMSTDEILETEEALIAYSGSWLFFSPIVDGDSVKYTLSEALEKGLFDGIPVIMGVTESDLGEKGELLSSSLGFLSSRKGRGYLYAFNHPLPPDDISPFHSADLWYVFGTLSRSRRSFQKEDYALSSYIIDMMTKFVKTGSTDWKEAPEVNVLSQTFTCSSCTKRGTAGIVPRRDGSRR